MTQADESTLAYTNLQPDDIFETLDDLGYVCNGRFLALNSYENRVYKLGIDDADDIVVKFYRPGRWSDDAIREEHEFTIELEHQEIPVVSPISIDDETLFKTGPFRLAVYPCRGGRAPDLDNDKQLRQLGRFVGRMHLVGETREFEYRPRVDIESYGLASRDFLLDEAFIPDEMCDVYDSIADLVIDGVERCSERAGSFREIRLHADFHPGNVLIAGEAFHIVDLDDARSGPAVQDLWMFMSGDRDEQTPQLTALLEGYQEFRPFDARELHLVEALRSLRIMHYAAWIARRWGDPAFKQAFPWFNARRYWDEHILALREQVALMQEAPLEWRDY
ncbi:MAG: serine/threonine protein kinase [Gammaproteobacteria bacterium]|nr:serine/threonine protein kinase [Gammaproteobacteria bacterium]